MHASKLRCLPWNLIGFIVVSLGLLLVAGEPTPALETNVDRATEEDGLLLKKAVLALLCENAKRIQTLEIRYLTIDVKLPGHSMGLGGQWCSKRQIGTVAPPG
ncbi:MAG: hypothetical protein AB7K24_22580 [Gemmataceae bacterium]